MMSQREAQVLGIISPLSDRSATEKMDGENLEVHQDIFAGITKYFIAHKLMLSFNQLLKWLKAKGDTEV